MRESEHFNLFLAEGSDIVNPLVQDVQNYESIDAQMFKNQNAGVQNATELKNGTVHAITRNVPDAQFITFTATSNYTAGETFTVDGVQVSALTVSGETLPTGAYVINSQVLCVLKGTLLTVYGIGSDVADNSLALNGHPDTYFGTKEDVDNAIDTANAAKELVNETNNSLYYKKGDTFNLPGVSFVTFGSTAKRGTIHIDLDKPLNESVSSVNYNNVNIETVRCNGRVISDVVIGNAKIRTRTRVEFTVASNGFDMHETVGYAILEGSLLFE